MRILKWRFLALPFLLLALTVGLLRPGAASALPAAPADTDPQKLARETRESLGWSGLAMRVLSRDTIETEYLAGTDGTGRPLTADTALPVGSVSKSFTALAVLQFVHAGDVELDAPVARYLTWIPNDETTVRDLLTHRSGLSAREGLDAAERYDNSSRAVTKAARDLPLEGLGHARTFAYSDANYLLLGALVERLAARDFGDPLERSLLRPLGLTRTVATAQGARRVDMGAGSQWSFHHTRAVSARYDASGAPFGYVMSNLDDLTRYVRWFQSRSDAVVPAKLRRLARRARAPQANLWHTDSVGARACSTATARGSSNTPERRSVRSPTSSCCRNSTVRSSSSDVAIPKRSPPPGRSRLRRGPDARRPRRLPERA
ncbi:serine hydrolase domain-containing protein [Dermacoccus barathri]